jgi:hypothetical protein
MAPSNAGPGITHSYPDPRAYGDNSHLREALETLTANQQNLQRQVTTGGATVAAAKPPTPPKASTGSLMTAALGTSLGPSQAPPSATAPGMPGQVTWDSGFLYVCIAQNTWVRTALSTF